MILPPPNHPSRTRRAKPQARAKAIAKARADAKSKSSSKSKGKSKSPSTSMPPAKPQTDSKALTPAEQLASAIQLLHQFVQVGVANDSGPFSQAGLKATTLLAFKMPQQMVAFYHQKWDGPEILTMEPLFNVLKLAFEWIRNGGE